MCDTEDQDEVDPKVIPIEDDESETLEDVAKSLFELEG